MCAFASDLDNGHLCIMCKKGYILNTAFVCDKQAAP